MLTHQLIERFLSDSAAKIEFDLKRCLRSRFNKNTCLRCLEGCQSGALELRGGKIIHDAEKCTGCMKCTAVCQNDAFAHNIDFLARLDYLAAKETVLLSCKKGILNHNHITVPCIGFLSEPMLAAMNSVANDECFIDIRPCTDCINSHCLNTLHENMQSFVNKMANKEDIRLRFHSDQQTISPSAEKNERRSFLRLFQKNIADMGKDAMNFQPSETATSKEQLSKKQGRNASVLQHALSITKDERRFEKDALLAYFFSVSTNDQCDCCPSCTGMCPTGALKRKKEKGKKHLTFTSALCSGCGLCASFCRKNALTVKSGFSKDPNLTLQIADN